MPDTIHPSDLPNEILAIIINELASDEDNESLASCRLASHVLCSIATPLFFSSIELTNYTARKTRDDGLLVKRAARLNEILTIQNIAASVYTLTLCCYHSYQALEDSTCASLMSTILHRLPHIRIFTLESHQYFSAFPEELASAIRALCRSPNLTTLYLHYIRGFPFTAITGCPNLRCLRLWHINSLVFNYVDEISSPQLSYLDSLEIYGNGLYTLGPRIKDLSIARHFTRIKNLQVRHHNAELLTYGWDIMLLASQTLAKLDLILDHNSVYNAEPEHVWNIQVVPFDLARLPALRHLKIQRWNSYGDSLALLRFLTRLLSLSSSSNGIEVLEIETTWLSIEDEHGKDLFLSNADWSTLDQLLTSQMFGSLRKVVLRFDMEFSKWGYPHHQHIMELERNLINNLFPLLRGLERTVESHLKFTF